MYKLIFYSVLLFFAVPTYTASAYMAPSTAKTNIQKQCGICLDEKPKVAFVDLECGHNYCFDCLQSMVDMALREKSSQDLKCPNPRCKKTFSHRDIFNITNSKKIVDDIAQIQMYELMATLPDAKHCPTPNCNYVFIGDDSGQPFKVTCPICHQKYCSKCLKDHDPKISCQEATQLQQQDIATIEYLRANKIKPCPQCGIHVEKIDGCDYVTCKKCVHGFCINCYGQHHVNKCAEPEVDPYAKMLTEAPKAQVPTPKNLASIPPVAVQHPKQANLPKQIAKQNVIPKTNIIDPNIAAKNALRQQAHQEALKHQLNDAILMDSIEEIKHIVALMRAAYPDENPLELIHYTPNRNNALQQAVILGRPNAITTLLKEGMNPNSLITMHSKGNTRPTYYTLLHWALEHGDIRSALALARGDARIDTMSNKVDLMELLFNTIKANVPLGLELIQEFINRGYNLHQEGEDINTIEGARVFQKNIWELLLNRPELFQQQIIFDFLIQHGANVNQPIFSSRRSARVVPLFFAIQANNVDAVRMLLAAGANPNANIQVEEKGQLTTMTVKQYAQRPGVNPEIRRML